LVVQTARLVRSKTETEPNYPNLNLLGFGFDKEPISSNFLGTKF